MMPSSRAVGALAVAALAVVAGIAVLVSLDSGGSGREPRPPAGGPRTGVEWCVDAPEGREDLVDQVRFEVESAMPEIKSTAGRISGGRLAYPEPQSIEGGCPGFSTLYGRGETPFLRAEDGAFVDPGRAVSVPGRFSLMIWVLPDDDIERIFGTNGFRFWGEEHTCSGDDCQPVTGGLYFTADEVREPKVLRYWLYEYFGLTCYAPANAIPENLTWDEPCRR